MATQLAPESARLKQNLQRCTLRNDRQAGFFLKKDPTSHKLAGYSYADAALETFRRRTAHAERINTTHPRTTHPVLSNRHYAPGAPYQGNPRARVAYRKRMAV